MDLATELALFNPATAPLTWRQRCAASTLAAGVNRIGVAVKALTLCLGKLLRHYRVRQSAATPVTQLGARYRSRFLRQPAKLACMTHATSGFSDLHETSGSPIGAEALRRPCERYATWPRSRLDEWLPRRTGPASCAARTRLAALDACCAE